jgi:hypothetical protein
MPEIFPLRQKPAETNVSAGFILLSGVPLLIQLYIPEVEDHIDGDLNKVQEVEGPAKEEDPAVAAVGIHNEVLGDTKDVADPDKDLKLQALTLGSPGFPGFIHRQRPAQTKADDHYGFAQSSNGCRIQHNSYPFLFARYSPRPDA